MHRPLFTILLLLTTLFHAVNGVFSAGQVLCIGADHHVAFEPRHHEACPATAAKSYHCHSDDADENAPASIPPKTCIDLDLSADADANQIRVSIPAHELLDSFASAPLVAGWMTSALIPSSHPSWAGPPADSPMHSSLGCLATIVLLI